MSADLLSKGDWAVLRDSGATWRSEPMPILAVTAFGKRVRVEDGREYRRTDGAWWDGDSKVYWPFPYLEFVDHE
jgi:hypothetical protein